MAFQAFPSKAIDYQPDFIDAIKIDASQGNSQLSAVFTLTVQHMRKKATPRAQAIWGALAGCFLTGIILIMAGIVSAGVFPLMLKDELDPILMGHSILVLLLVGTIAGAIIGVLSARRTSRHDATLQAGRLDSRDLPE